MGGTIGFTLRERSGRAHRMRRWTNILPWAITNAGMAAMDEEHVAAVLRSWVDMKDDWARNHASGEFEHPMTSCYVSDTDELAPVGYGLVLVDMMERVILSLQGYTSLGSIVGASVDLDRLNGERAALADPHSDLARLKGLHEAGRVVRSVCYPEGGRELSGLSWEALLQALDEDSISRESGRVGPRPVRIEIDLSPFTIENFAESREGVGAMHQRVQELGFTLSVGEQALWAEFAAEFDDT